MENSICWYNTVDGSVYANRKEAKLIMGTNRFRNAYKNKRVIAITKETYDKMAKILD